MATDLSGRVVGNYRIVEKIGEGGMGTVYRAVDSMLDREVALKAIRPSLAEEAESVQRFRAEARLAARLVHPAIATIFGFFAEGEQLFLAMELVRGESLAQRLKRRGALPWPEAVQIVAAALEGVAVAHRAGIVHRDLKPDNLMVTEQGGIKVMDFGIARAVEGTRLTRTGLLVGTLAYMAPELIRGEEVDHRTDLYSLGIVLYQSLTGRPPFEGGSDFAILKAQIDEAPKPPGALVAGLPSWLEGAVLRVLAKEPGLRFESADEMRQVLLAGAAAAAVDLPATELRPSPLPIPPPPPPPPGSGAVPPPLAGPPSAPAEAATSPAANLPTHTTRSPAFRPDAARFGRPFVAVVLVALGILGGILAWRLLERQPRPEEQAAAADPKGVLPSETFLGSASEKPAASNVPTGSKPSPPVPEKLRPAVVPEAQPVPLPAPANESSVDSEVSDLTVLPLPAEPDEPADTGPAAEGELGTIGQRLVDQSSRLSAAYSTFLERKEEGGEELTEADEALRDELAEFEEYVGDFAGAQEPGFLSRLRRRGQDAQRLRRRIAEALAPVRSSAERIDNLMATVSPSPEVRQIWREIKQRTRRLAAVVGP